MVYKPVHIWSLALSSNQDSTITLPFKSILFHVLIFFQSELFLTNCSSLRKNAHFSDKCHFRSGVRLLSFHLSKSRLYSEQITKASNFVNFRIEALQAISSRRLRQRMRNRAWKDYSLRSTRTDVFHDNMKANVNIKVHVGDRAQMEADISHVPEAAHLFWQLKTSGKK
jgi:hypothetical protein